MAATLEDLKFRVAQAERRGKQEVLSSSKLQQRLEDAAHRAAKAEATAEEAWQAATAHEAAARDAEGRRAEAEAAAQAADARCQVRCIAALCLPSCGALQAERARLDQTLRRHAAVLLHRLQWHHDGQRRRIPCCGSEPWCQP